MARVLRSSCLSRRFYRCRSQRFTAMGEFAPARTRLLGAGMATAAMRIVALLAFYDEQPAWLHQAITSLQLADVDHLIACDGAFRLYPDGKARSPLEQHEAIHRAAETLGVGLTLHTPVGVWVGNECEKRSKLFQLGDTEAEPNRDWFMVWDADQILTDCPADLKQQLATTTLDVGEATFSEPHPELKRRDFPIPIFFRAIPGIQVEGNHFTYKTRDGRFLWVNASTDDLESRLDLRAVKVEHLTHYRDLDRRVAASEYYKRRKENVTEDFICGHPPCGRTASYSLPIHWHANTGGFVAEWIWVCSKHQPDYALRGCRELATHVGWDRAFGYYIRKLWLTASDELAVENRAGPVPA